MIHPVCKGVELIAQIGASRPAPGAVAIWWLGQSGFLVKSRHGTILIDPYLSESLTKKYAGTTRAHIRMTAAPLRGGDLSGLVDWILVTHKHSDHCDPETLRELTWNSIVILPAALVEHAHGLGLNGKGIDGIEAGETASLGWRGRTKIRAIPSAHEGLDTDTQGRHLYLGFVVEMDGLRLYHSGDSLAYEGLEGRLGPEPFDVMFLPINGRDPARGVPGNMSAAEAVDLAGRVRPRFVVPHHYDMFTFNTVPVAEFEREAARLPAGVVPKVLRCGERWEVGP